MPKVYSKRHGAEEPPRDAVYIGRGTPWGNPHILHDANDMIERFHVIALYTMDLMDNPELQKRIRDELRGKDLLCWCAPLPCHGDLLLEIANA